MNYGSSSRPSGPRTATRRSFEYGRTYVVRPKGRHQATIVWLHGLGDNGASWSQLLESLPLPNVKWICPTAPTRPVAAFGGFPCTAWFDVKDLSEYGPDDVEGTDVSAAHVANLLSAEPADGDDVVPYKHGERSAEVLRSSGFRNLTFKTYNGLGHYTVPEQMDDVCRWLTARLGHYTVPEQMDDVCRWLTARLGLDGSRS
ncbi:Acyl-protein thioesterase 1 [Cocos nucifera]|nr:Acyl-protein thioesterase 1 [Cocos nucifera]